MSYSLYHSNPFIDLCTDSINVLRPRHSLVYNHSHSSDLSIAVEFMFIIREMSLTSLSFCELPKIVPGMNSLQNNNCYVFINMFSIWIFL